MKRDYFHQILFMYYLYLDSSINKIFIFCLIEMQYGNIIWKSDDSIFTENIYIYIAFYTYNGNNY